MEEGIFADLELNLDAIPAPKPITPANPRDKTPDGAESPSEWKIVAELAGKNIKDCIEYIWIHYYHKLMGYVYKRVHDREVAEAIVMDVFRKVTEQYTKGESGNIATKSFSGWIFRIARNVLMDHFRRQRATPLQWDEQLDALISDSTPIELEVFAKENRDLLIRAISMISSPNQRKVIELRSLEQYSIAETAKRMGRTEGAIKALQNRALISLRKLLGLDVTSERDATPPAQPF